VNIKLVVVRSFGLHAPGDLISDSKETAEILGGEHAHDVVRVSGPETTAGSPNAPATQSPKAGGANPSGDKTKEG